uniref:Uncharacterized protein n=1 Tax=Ananas comosus var. bracteatus TaxID=296719 RepID=A0A6V7P5H3_ANACO|nr:unnamed protein product [Ananas comosus var. bracteatus]
MCCELLVGYMKFPVAVLLELDRRKYYMPMATTEASLVVSTNSGCKAIAEAQGFMENSTSFKMLSVVFNNRWRHRLSLRLMTAAPILPPPRDCVNNFGNLGIMNC